MRQLLLLRPEPGLSASAARARELGIEIIACPLFRIEPVKWDAPDPAAYDGLLLTSAKAVRCGGPGLAKLKSLPVHCVGAATAEAAREAGFEVETQGEGDVEDLLQLLSPRLRLLHLAGEEHRPFQWPSLHREIVYRSRPVERPELPSTDGLVIAVHSPRAGTRLAELANGRDLTMIAAISQNAAEAVGSGWERVEIAQQPNDSSLLALAAMLCHTSPPK